MFKITAQTIKLMGLARDEQIIAGELENITTGKRGGAEKDYNKPQFALFSVCGDNPFILDIARAAKWTTIIVEQYGPQAEIQGFITDDRFCLTCESSEVRFCFQERGCWDTVIELVRSGDELVLKHQPDLERLKQMRSELALARKTLAQKKQAGKAFDTLKRARGHYDSAARHYEECKAKLEGMTFAQAVAQARAVRDARRLMAEIERRLEKPTPGMVLEYEWVNEETRQRYLEIYSSYSQALEYFQAYHPRNPYSKSAMRESDKRFSPVKSTLLSMGRLLTCALSDHLGEVYDQANNAHTYRMNRYRYWRRIVNQYPATEAQLRAHVETAEAEFDRLKQNYLTLLARLQKDEPAEHPAPAQPAEAAPPAEERPANLVDIRRVLARVPDGAIYKAALKAGIRKSVREIKEQSELERIYKLIPPGKLQRALAQMS